MQYSERPLGTLKGQWADFLGICAPRGAKDAEQDFKIHGHLSLLEISRS